MDRIHINYKGANLQLDKKAMPGETRACYMITSNGNFRGYVAILKNGGCEPIGTTYYTTQELQMISEELTKVI